MKDVIDGIDAITKEVVTRVHLLVWVSTTFAVSMAGPFGTYEALTFQMRVSYWGLIIAVSMVIALFFRVLWRLILKGEPAWLEDFFVIASLAIVFGPTVVSVNATFFPWKEEPVGWPMVSAVTFAVGVGTVAMRRLIHREVAATMPLRRDRLLDRIGAPEGARLARVCSDNHHIRVITADTTEYRILMRLGDAVKEIDVEPGFCVHRSHWVATRQITHVERDQGREVLRLPCGGGVPIGPKYRSNLVDAGFLSA